MKHCAKHNNNIKSHTHRNSTHVVINAAFLISLNEQPSNQPTNVLLINTIPFYCDLRHLSQLLHSPANASHLTLHVAPATKIAYPNKVKVWCGILHSVPRRRRSFCCYWWLWNGRRWSRRGDDSTSISCLVSWPASHLARYKLRASNSNPQYMHCISIQQARN